MADPHQNVVVVGGGIVGLSCAVHLLQRGWSVTVIDRGHREGRCSYGNAGSISPGSVAPLAMPGMMSQIPGWLLDPAGPVRVPYDYWLRAFPWLFSFIRAAQPHRVEEISWALKSLLGDSIERYVRLLAELRSPGLLARTGQLQLYPTRKAFEKDARIWQLRRKRGVVVEDVTRDEIRQLEPAVADEYGHGVFLPNEGLIRNPARLVDILGEYVARNGGQVINGEAQGFTFSDDQVCGLMVNGSKIAADQIVVAAGAWSNNLTSQLGDDFPLQTQRGYHVTISTPGIELRRPVVAADRKFFVSPMENGIRIAGTIEIADLAAPPDFARARSLALLAPRLLPELNVTGGAEWMGHRPCTPDSLPVIDRSRLFPNVFYAFGNGHLGLTAAPMVGDLIAALVSGAKAPIDAAPFSTRRFSHRRHVASRQNNAHPALVEEIKFGAC